MTLKEELDHILPKERLKTKLIDLLAFSSDAGFYRLIPQAVLQPDNSSEIKKIFALSSRLGIPLTFRTGGTSLSGQSISDGLLIDLSQHWRKISPEEEGLIVRVEPGAIGSWVNYSLKKYGRKIGPDPSSIAAAMMGGILANNASGMCCGVQHNSYHTLKSLRFVLPSGNEFDTGNAQDYQRFQIEESELFATINQLRTRILSNRTLSDKIRSKYKMKNTVGYALNSFLDHEDPLDIFAHLLIGSEGTLAFIVEAVLHTLPDLPYKSTALLLFTNIVEACNAIQGLKEMQAEAVELMDRASLRSVEHKEGMPSELALLPESAVALLVEFQSDTYPKLVELVKVANQFLTTLHLLSPANFSEETKNQALLWKIRKGLFPAVGAVRQQGTTVILEDIVFPLPLLAKGIMDLQALFKKHSYDNAIIFGHAKDGNIHFVLTQLFHNEKEIKRYELFIQELVDLVVHKYDGSLKAEHGTGRNMAPFVETEWGPEAYAIMKEVKRAVDPFFLLNPGVMISSDKYIHLKHLKALPIVEEEVDKCIECGFCEPICPSRDVTMTPRRRIVVRRLMSDPNLPYSTNKELLEDYQYQGLDTCAADGLCATDCPVDINTGDLVKRLRRNNHTPFQQKLALGIAQHFYQLEMATSAIIKMGTWVNTTFPNSLVKLTTGLRKIEVPIPVWMSNLHSPKRTLRPLSSQGGNQVVVYPTCIQRMMGGNTKENTWWDTLISLSVKADIHLITQNNKGLCCGQAFSSKGFTKAAAYSANQSMEWLWTHSQEGKFPVLMDTSSCSYTLSHSSTLLNPVNRERLSKLQLIDVTEFCFDYLLPHLSIQEKKQQVALHPVCSLEKMKLIDKLIQTAQACAHEVIIPQHAGCCGMAGDKGFFFPELTQAATHFEAEEIKRSSCEGYYSTGRSCEMSISESSGKEYVSLLYLLDEVSEGR